MKDLAFYDTHEPQGIKKLVVIPRRVLRRLLRPIFQRQVALFQYIIDRLDAGERAVLAVRDRASEAHDRIDVVGRRQDELSEQLQTTLAFGWDYVALVRRLAVLEDQLATLQGVAPGRDEDESNASILFPGLEKMAHPGAKSEAEALARVR